MKVIIMLKFFNENSFEIYKKILEHLYISTISLGLGILIAVPIGIFLIRSQVIAKIFMALASVLQTVPSLPFWQ